MTSRVRACERRIQVDIPHCNSAVMSIADAEQLAEELEKAIAEARAEQPYVAPSPASCATCGLVPK